MSQRAVLVAAAGNANIDSCSFAPALVREIITVGSAYVENGKDFRSSFSNHGECVDIFAPGQNIRAALKDADDSYDSWEGTSMAAPHVSGVAAVIWSQYPSESAVQIMNRVLNAAIAGKIFLLPPNTANKMLYLQPPQHTPACAAGEEPVAGKCIRCAVNHFCPGGYTAKIPCPANSDTRSATGARSVSACKCQTGSYFNQNRCPRCLLNHFCLGTDHGAAPCINGFTDGEGSVRCKCNGGYFWSNNQCVPCLPGHYCERGRDQEKCRDFSSSPAQSDSPARCVCNAGFFENGAKQCETCLPNHYCTNNAWTKCRDFSSSPAGSDSPTDCVCNGGYFENAAKQCEICPSGHYCFNNAFMRCREFSSSPRGSDAPDDCMCNGGYYEDFRKQCQYCPANYYCSNNLQKQCREFSSSPAGSASPTNCVCDGGYFENVRNRCESCTPDYYCLNNMLKKCRDFSTSPARSDSPAKCLCNPGYYENAARECGTCAPGVYCLGGLTPPQQCPRNSATPEYASVSKLQCQCFAGFYRLANDECEICPYSHYCQNGRKTECPFKHSIDQGAKSLADCRCGPGQYEINGDCKKCEEKHFCLGKKEPMRACPENTRTLQIGAVRETDCKCVAGFFGSGGTDCAQCTEGFFCGENTQHGELTECPLQHFCPLGSVEPVFCDSAMAGSSNEQAGSKSVLECLCPEGEYRDMEEQTCKQCPVGSVCINSEMEVCGEYATTRLPGATTFDQCFCKAGYYGDGRLCQECGLGKFCPTGARTRTSCGSGRTTKIKTASSRIDCQCMPGHEPNGIECKQCADNSFKPYAGNYACTPLDAMMLLAKDSSRWQCAPHATLDAQKKTCVSCPEKTAKLMPGNETCTACDQIDQSECGCNVESPVMAEMCQRCGQFICTTPFWATIAGAGVAVLTIGISGARLYHQRKSRSPMITRSPSAQHLHRSESNLQIDSPLSEKKVNRSESSLFESQSTKQSNRTENSKTRHDLKRSESNLNESASKKLSDQTDSKPQPSDSTQSLKRSESKLNSKQIDRSESQTRPPPARPSHTPISGLKRTGSEQAVKLVASEINKTVQQPLIQSFKRSGSNLTELMQPPQPPNRSERIETPPARYRDQLNDSLMQPHVQPTNGLAPNVMLNRSGSNMALPPAPEPAQLRFDPLDTMNLPPPPTQNINRVEGSVERPLQEVNRLGRSLTRPAPPPQSLNRSGSNVKLPPPPVQQIARSGSNLELPPPPPPPIQQVNRSGSNLELPPPPTRPIVRSGSNLELPPPPKKLLNQFEGVFTRLPQVPARSEDSISRPGTNMTLPPPPSQPAPAKLQNRSGSNLELPPPPPATQNINRSAGDPTGLNGAAPVPPKRSQTSTSDLYQTTK